MPSAAARQFEAVAARLRFRKTRTTRSHERWNHPDGRAITIPIHGGREIGPPLFFTILRRHTRRIHQPDVNPRYVRSDIRWGFAWYRYDA